MPDVDPGELNKGPGGSAAVNQIIPRSLTATQARVATRGRAATFGAEFNAPGPNYTKALGIIA
jgi:hypothetical protein